MPKQVHEFIWKTVLFSLTGLTLGDLINSTFTKLCKKFPKFKILFACLQLCCLGIVMNVIYRFRFAKEFQTTLPGLSFPAFYFATQKNIYSIWYETSYSKIINEIEEDTILD